MSNFGFDQATGGVVNAPPSLEMGGYSQGVSSFMKGKHLLVIIVIIAVIYIWMKKKGS